MAGTRTIQEGNLRALLGDTDDPDDTISEYFEPDGFSARLVPQEDVSVEMEEGYIDKGLVSAAGNAFLRFVNSHSTASRQRRYRKTISENPDLPRVVAEGDSWFLHPKIVDIIDQLFPKNNPRWAVFSLAAAGDHLSEIWRQNAYLDAAEREDAALILLGGGGNDILGAEFPGFLNDYTPDEPGTNIDRFLNVNFPRKLLHLRDVYESILTQLRKARPETRVVLHGYDYITPGVETPDRDKHQHKGKWLGNHLSHFGINEDVDRAAVVSSIVDGFNESVLKPITERHSNAVYVDLRGTIGSHEWYDEIHPSDDGFNAVAVKIDAAMRVE